MADEQNPRNRDDQHQGDDMQRDRSKQQQGDQAQRDRSGQQAGSKSRTDGSEQTDTLEDRNLSGSSTWATLPEQEKDNASDEDESSRDR